MTLEVTMRLWQAQFLAVEESLEPFIEACAWQTIEYCDTQMTASNTANFVSDSLYWSGLDAEDIVPKGHCSGNWALLARYGRTYHRQLKDRGKLS